MKIGDRTSDLENKHSILCCVFMIYTVILSVVQTTQYWMVGYLMKKMERLWNEWDVVYFKLLFQHLLGGTKKHLRKPQSK